MADPIRTPKRERERERERDGPATDPRRFRNDNASLAFRTGQRACSVGDIDNAKGLVLLGTNNYRAPALRSAICSYISARFSKACRSSGYLLARMHALIARLSQ
jgi:hypothetical protein